jgi:hypothetical protein
MARHRRAYQGERRTEGSTVQWTKSERAALTARAEGRGLALSYYIRSCCLTDRLPPATTRRPKGEAWELIAAMARIGNNLNQLAHHANALGALPTERALLDAIAELNEATRRVMGV